MFLIIKDNRSIHKYTLCDDIEYKGIKIYKNKDNYYIILSNDLYFSDKSKLKPLEISKYEIQSNNNFYKTEIFVYDNDSGIDDFDLYENTNFIIANNEKAGIVCKDKYLDKYYLSVKDRIINSNFDIVVNNKQYNNECLSDGDVIEYLGIKIIYYDEYLYINSFNCDIRIKKYRYQESVIKYPLIQNNINYCLMDTVKELKIEDIKDYLIPKNSETSQFIKTIIPNIVMCSSMTAMSVISLYSSSNQSDISKLSYIIMPVSMLITSIFIPLCFFIYEKVSYRKECIRKKQDYLDYLSRYYEDLKISIDGYVESLNTRYFSLINAKDSLFYASSKSDDFLKLSIGKKTVSKDIEIKHYDDKQIDELLNRIKNSLDHIENCPLLLDLKANRIVSIVCKKSSKLSMFYKVLLELSFKHHYDDLYIAVYSKNSSIFDRFYNLPHLFINKKRLTVVNEKQIQELDQLNLDKPMVLLIYDKLDYEFSNESIHVIYFGSDITDLYKDSDAVVEYLNTKGYLYLNGKHEFTYVEERVNYEMYFEYLGKLKAIDNHTNDYRFTDIYLLNIKDNYLKYNSGLVANFAYSNNELINFDLHESKQGPHGLIGGCTGSGKSELIISLLLSLCIRYSPEYLNIVLIDYKGGGIKESLSYNSVCIPHIVASISNLENNALERLIISLNNECRYRQDLFKKLSRCLNISIMNIDDYLDNDYGKYNLDRLSHLIVVVDEFAELKKEHPEQIKDLISLSRIGRSLGLHLILATQKPAGVIDDEIWSNSRFKLALKVLEEKDSIDIIKNKNAAYISNCGSFLLKVDNGLIKAQSIYCKNDIYGNDPYRVSLLDNTLQTINSFKKSDVPIITEASEYCKEIIKTSRNMKLKTRSIEFMPPPEKQRKRLSSGECLIMGEIDDYINGQRGLLAYNLDENLLICSSRKDEINSILNTFNEFKRRCVVIGSKKYSGSYICDSVVYDNNEDIEFLFEYLLINNNLNLTLVIEDVNCLLSYGDNYLDYLYKLCKRNISLIFITSNSQISFKLINSFKHRIIINSNDSNDLSSFYACRSNYKGNSYFYRDEPICFVPVITEVFNESRQLVPNLIRHIPEVVSCEIKDGMYLLGYDTKTKQPVYSDSNLFICSMDTELLDRYRDSYKEIKGEIYAHSLKIKNSNILWLGPGVFNQRLFVTGLKDDLDNDEALYIRNNKKYVLRSLNHA